MRSPRLLKAYLFLAVALLGGNSVFAAEQIIPHSDRSTPKIIFNPANQVQGTNKVAVAEQYLRSSWSLLGLRENASNMKLVREQESLLGYHAHYQQWYQGVPVEGSEVIVSVSKDTKRVYQVFNSTWPEPASKRPRQENLELDSEEALDLSWDHLRVHGPLTAMPTAEKTWLVADGVFTLVWRTHILAEAPYGSWSVVVDAMTGEVLSAKDIAIYRKPKPTVDYAAYTGPINDRLLEQNLLARSTEKTKTEGKRVDGSGKVFDPDPRTTLNDATLLDSSPAAAFTAAYFDRPLRDITQSGGTFSLVGPWVRLADFESPRVAPSTSANGVWNFTRDDNQFNDAMTYFHLDQSQRYMQSLGFSIQNLPIETDANGFNGADNSHYISGSSSIGVNRLAFGHGCVDDNEDTDVILHEYGHAIQKFINGNWNGGDTGAMGEGFGDYWGAAYSYTTTPNGKTFHPEWIYSWDGHGDPIVDCWDGRLMNQTHLQYVPGTEYGDHQPIPGGESDELWGTPLFQAMVALDQQGHPTAEADQIILQSHYGLGTDITMPELAQSTVNAAMQLFPSGPHAQVFHDAFAVHNIPTSFEGTSHVYISAHVPPNNDWVNEIEIVNPNDATATITASVFELVDSTYRETHTTEFTLAGNAATTFSPEGSAQRWVRFTSDQPLSGVSFFSRTAESRGQEKAGIPLFKEDEQGTTLIIPHIPADRIFFSGAVILNPNDQVASLDFELYSSSGTRIDEVLNDSAPVQLDPREKWVGFLSPFGDAASLFNDENGGEKVSYVKVVSSQPIVSFELFGYKATSATSPLATSGIKALPNQDMVVYPVRISLTDAAFSSFSILNSANTSANISAQVYDDNGTKLAEVTTSIPARTKKLGLNINADGVGTSFNFPTVSPQITLSNPDDLVQVVISGPSALRIFELTGTGSWELDGGAVTEAASRQTFARPEGTLELFRVSGSGTVTVRMATDGSATDTTYNMVSGGFEQILLPAGLESVTVTGEGISASVITHNEVDGSITVVNGSSVD